MITSLFKHFLNTCLLAATCFASFPCIAAPFADEAPTGVNPVDSAAFENLINDLSQSDDKGTLVKLKNLTNRASELVMQAVGMLGIRYKYGGNSPESGLDCSGLVAYVFKQAWGTDLPRTSREISMMGQNVDTQDLKPGDLVFYNTLRRGFSHVGIYLGDNKFIHSPSGGGEVRIENMEQSYWKNRFDGARRISDPTVH
jgi:cell wall-associated NlpC family hydrolase